MKSRDQFLRTINHRQPDRLVIDIGSTAVTGIHIRALSRLRRFYGLQRKPIRVIEPMHMLGEVSWELIDAAGIDVLGIWPEQNLFRINNCGPYKEWKTPWGQRVRVPMQFNPMSNFNEDVLMFPYGDNFLPSYARMPKTGFTFDVEPGGLTAYDLHDEAPAQGGNVLLTGKDLEHWKTETDKAYFSGKAVMASLGWITAGLTTMVPGFYSGHAGRIHQASALFSQIGSHSKQQRKYLDEQTDFAIENLRRLYSVVGNKINAVYLCGTDFGTQNPPLFNPEQFNAIWIPVYKKLNDWIHTHTQWKTFKYSYSLSEQLIEQFVRAGFDIINTLQVNDTVQELKRIKEKYGNDLVFWGGGIDTVHFLPAANPENVREAVLRNCEILNKNGGFVFAPDFNIPANVPPENIVALFEAIQEFNGQPSISM